ncbi:VOC family protein [Nocardia sp. NPDC058640]|uniref:VOC family protein n=1 Tax=Nocardia sp. NPDC058640 TaxID=3346571 RepID=UPI003666F999
MVTDFAVPILWAGDLTSTLDFYRALGFTVTWEQSRPYVYGSIEKDSCALHFVAAPPGIDLPAEHAAALLLVDDVAARHAEYTAALRAHFGKIPIKGCPRITRFRPGQTRFTLVDPVGNWITVIQHGEPDFDYGGSHELEGLAKVLDNARILRDFKTDDRAATRALETGLRRFTTTATPLDRARAYTALIELTTLAGDSDKQAHWKSELAALDLTPEERTTLAELSPPAAD